MFLEAERELEEYDEDQYEDPGEELYPAHDEDEEYRGR